jgi:glycosyltransferase involved in cell wall biosynthesis
MKVAYVSPFYDPAVAAPVDMLERYPILRELPAALSRRGIDVNVFLHASSDAVIQRAGVSYRFIASPVIARPPSFLLHRWKPRHGPAYYQPMWRLSRQLRDARPDVVHVAGMTLDIQLAIVARVCDRLQVPLVVHYHGGAPARGRMAGLQRHNLRRADAALFTAPEQADSWLAAGMLRDAGVVRIVIETSSPFRGIAKDTARALTGMHGDPVYLSAGRLHPVKDPLTMLAGFARIAADQPGARLFLHYLTDEQLPEVQRLIFDTPGLHARVELRGRAAASDMEAVYSSADFLLQASVREWSGLALLEAMACGCVPIVTDIPSFRAMTAGGRFGRLFPRGDPDALARSALAIGTEERETLAKMVREHFEHELSFDAMARKLETIYHEVR